MTARVLNRTNKHGGEKSNGTQETVSQNLLIKILYLAEFVLVSYFQFKMEVEQTNFVTFNNYSKIILLII